MQLTKALTQKQLQSIRKSAELLEKNAELIRQGHTLPNGRWPRMEFLAKREWQQYLQLVGDLRQIAGQ